MMKTKQRGSLTFDMILYGIVGLMILGAAGYAWYQANHWCNAACEDLELRLRAAKATIDGLEAQKKAAQDRADAVQAKYDEAQARNDAQLKTNREAHYAQLAQLDVQIKGLRARNTSLSRDLLRVWQRATDAANEAAGHAAAAQGSDGPAAQVPEPAQGNPIITISEHDLAVFARDAAGAYGACAVRLKTCTTMYNDARNAQLQ